MYLNVFINFGGIPKPHYNNFLTNYITIENIYTPIENKSDQEMPIAEL